MSVYQQLKNCHLLFHYLFKVFENKFRQDIEILLLMRYACGKLMT